MMKLSVSLLVVFVLAAGCARKSPQLSPEAFRVAVAGTDWELHEIHGLQGGLVPQGNGGRRATIRFEADSARVTGFGGCNRYFGTYALDGAALRFGGIGMTRMACPQGMSLERMVATALEGTRRYEIADRTLTLLGEPGPVAKFVRPSP